MCFILSTLFKILGTLTYRVVQVGPSGPEAVEPMAQIVSSPGYSAAGGN